MFQSRWLPIRSTMNWWWIECSRKWDTGGFYEFKCDCARHNSMSKKLRTELRYMPNTSVRPIAMICSPSCSSTQRKAAYIKYHATRLYL